MVTHTNIGLYYIQTKSWIQFGSLPRHIWQSHGCLWRRQKTLAAAGGEEELGRDRGRCWASGPHGLLQSHPQGSNEEPIWGYRLAFSRLLKYYHKRVSQILGALQTWIPGRPRHRRSGGPCGRFRGIGAVCRSFRGGHCGRDEGSSGEVGRDLKA